LGVTPVGGTPAGKFSRTLVGIPSIVDMVGERRG
jgi:hypothetical protein